MLADTVWMRIDYTHSPQHLDDCTTKKDIKA